MDIMEVEFVNMYIERLVKEVEELTKSRLLNEARLNYIESGNQKLIQVDTSEVF
jgi:DNA-binding Xre family transcriptional regulator